MSKADTVVVTEHEVPRTLRGVTLLDELDDDALVTLEEKCKWRRYRAGERLFTRGSIGGEVFFIVNGEMQILGVSGSGQDITLAHAHAGDTVGEMAAIDGQPRSASVVALEDSLVAVLDPDSFLDMLKQYGGISLSLLQRLSSMVRSGDDRVLELSILEAKQRICAELLRLAEPDASAAELWVIRPLPPLRNIAGNASTTREIVANTLGHLYPRNIAQRKGENLYILDRQALENFARTTL
jgi:CRP-like cAMP-binding protein